MNRRIRRVRAGLHFNEGARLLHLFLLEKDVSQADLTRALGVPLGVVNRWLYGDVRPGVRWALELLQTTGIAVSAWHSEALGPFVPMANKGKR